MGDLDRNIYIYIRCSSFFPFCHRFRITVVAILKFLLFVLSRSPGSNGQTLSRSHQHQDKTQSSALGSSKQLVRSEFFPFWLPEKVRRFNLGFLSQFEPFWFSPQPSAVWVRGTLFSVPMENQKHLRGRRRACTAFRSSSSPWRCNVSTRRVPNFQGPFKREYFMSNL